ncbi:BLUF domain-containing protein [Alsobacter sp. KACC 23698]|uniref:BLUF domain-containing protein n=1 Tax=Alsobacter sp. KACC 23698 TaxID=3149229 RepID=A0AAU7JMN1_9HYPH
MFQAIYSSEHFLPVDSRGYSPEFRTITEGARRRNEDRQITGFLICASSWFCQVLEGPEAHVMELLERIEDDPRHHCFQILQTQCTRDREFPSWSMAGVTLSSSAIVLQLILLERQFGRRHPPRDRTASELFDLCRALSAAASREVAPAFV